MKSSVPAKVHRLLTILIVVLSGTSLTMLFFLSLACRAFITFDNEALVITKNRSLFLPVAMLLFVLLILSGIVLKRIRPEILFCIGAVLYLLAGIYIFRNIDHTARYDQQYIFEDAGHINEGNYTVLGHERYLGRWPNQLGFLTWERALSVIRHSYRFYMLVNLLLIIGINFLLWRITTCILKLLQLKNGARLVENFTLLLVHLFLPHLLYFTFLYGTIPGLFFALAGVLALLHAGFGKHRWILVILSGLLLGTGVLMKQNYMLACISVCIILVLGILRDGKWIRLAVVAWIMICAVGMNRACIRYYETLSGHTLKGIPLIMNVAMGLHGDPYLPEIGHACGWVDGYNEVAYKLSGYDPDTASAEAWADLKGRAEFFRKNPAYMRDFFRQKMISTWCDPMFQAIWSGPLETCGAEPAKTPMLRQLYRGEEAYQRTAAYLNAFAVLMYGLCAAFSFRRIRRKVHEIELLTFVYFMGGFCFHLISETKGQYVYMYFLCLLPAAAAELASVYDHLDKAFSGLTSGRRALISKQTGIS